MGKGTGTETRATRGIALYRENAAEIVETDEGTYRVPGSRDVPYTVDVERGFCSCPDRAKRCKHLYAVEILVAKDRCKRSKTARPKRVRHEANPMFGAALRNPRFMADVI